MPDGHEDQSWEAGEALLGVVPQRRGEGLCEERKGEMGSHESCWLLNPQPHLEVGSIMPTLQSSK